MLLEELAVPAKSAVNTSTVRPLLAAGPFIQFIEAFTVTRRLLQAHRNLVAAPVSEALLKAVPVHVTRLCFVMLEAAREDPLLLLLDAVCTEGAMAMFARDLAPGLHQGSAFAHLLLRTIAHILHPTLGQSRQRENKTWLEVVASYTAKETDEEYADSGRCTVFSDVDSLRQWVFSK